jgi:hypothetical protein
MTRIAAVSIALLLLAAPAAHARSDRTAAKAFARAAKQLRAAVVARRQVVETGANRLTRDPACTDAFGHVPATGGAYEAAVALVFPYTFEAQIGPILPALDEYVAALGRVEVRDERLRGGRAALRRSVRTARGLRPAPADICARLQSWQQAGYPAGGAPVIDDPAYDRLLELPQSLGRKTARARKRLHALGVSKHTALLFTAADEALFAGFDLDTEVPIGDQAG